MTIPTCRTFATGQIPDILIYHGDTLYIYANPLEDLYTKKKSRPNFFGKKPHCNSTACWRGYQAKWQIINNELYLTEILSCCYTEDKTKANLARLFGKKFVNGKVKADWFSGKIISPQGKELYYVHMGYNSIYEKELEFSFKQGQIIGTKIYNNSKSKQSIYSQDEELLSNYIYTKINWADLPELHKQVVKIFVQFSANDKGIIDSLKILKGYDSLFDNEAIRVVKSIPEWDIYYRHEKHERSYWTLPIVFSEDNRRKYQK